MKRLAICSLVSCLGFCRQVSGQIGTITTVAGGGACCSTGDGGPATSATLNGPVSVAVDAAGNLFIADYGNNRIRRVSATGTITTVAGGGACCSTGDGGPTTSATLNGPVSVAVDAAGNLFIADYGNNRIRRVSATGTVTTAAGNGTAGFSGDGFPATSASLDQPDGVVVDLFGDLFVTDYGNNRVRKVSASGIITTVAGNGTAGFSGDGFPATSASLNGPHGVFLDASGNLFIADYSNNRIRKVSAVSAPISTQGIAITSLSTTSPIPLTPLYLGTSGIDAASPITVQFSNGSGFAVTQKTIRAATDGTVVVAVPLFVDPATGTFGPSHGPVSLVLTQGGQSSASAQISIQDLPSLSTYGVKRGQVSQAVLNLDAMLIAGRLNQLQAFQSLPSNSVDTMPAQETLKQLLNALLQAHTDVSSIANDSSVVIPASVLPSGKLVAFDASSLDAMDRINAVFLSGTFASLALSSPQPRNRSLPVQSTLAAVTKVLNQLAGAASISSTFAALAKAQTTSGDPTISKLFDEATAIVGGSASLVSALQDNFQLGAVGAVISDAHIVINSYTDLAVFADAALTGNQDLMSAVVDEVNQQRSSMYGAVADLLAAGLGDPYFGYTGELLSPVASTVSSLAGTALNLNETLKQIDSTEVSILTEVSTGVVEVIGTIEGHTDVSGNTAATGSQYGVDLSSGGIMLNTVTDSNGDFQIFVPIQVPNFDYGNANFQIVDPMTGQILGSQVMDVSSAASTTPLQTAPIEASYPPPPSSYDAGYCLTTVQNWDQLIAADVESAESGIAYDLNGNFPPGLAADAIDILRAELGWRVQDVIQSMTFFLTQGGCWEQIDSEPQAAAWPK